MNSESLILTEREITRFSFQDGKTLIGMESDWADSRQTFENITKIENQFKPYVFPQTTLQIHCLELQFETCLNLPDSLGVIDCRLHLGGGLTAFRECLPTRSSFKANEILYDRSGVVLFPVSFGF